MSIANLANATGIEVQYNPVEVEENLDVIYAAQTVPGLSHQILQYTNTGNLSITLDLKYDALTNPKDFDADDAINARKFLHSLCLPRRGATTIRDTAPPRCLFVWPTLYTLTTVIKKLRIRFTRFRQDGKPTAFDASVTIEEIRDMRITSEEVFADGTQRADSGGPSGGS